MICYTILHYMAEKMTVECVEALKKHIDLTSDCVIIVDNHSTNDSGRNIQNRYRDEPWCTVILNDKNEGFARGNNVGYYLARKMGADFVVIMNNDVIIDDPRFSEKLQALYDKTRFDVYGPDILSMATGEHQNVTQRSVTMESTEKLTKTYEKIAEMTPCEFYYWELRKGYRTFKKKVKHIIRYGNAGTDRQKNIIPEKDYNQPILHGACLIFSKRFIQQEEFAFNPNTFMFMEEEILNVECTQRGYRMIYDPVIQVRHYEDVATDFVFKTTYRKEHMKAVEILRSIQVLKSVMERDAQEIQRKAEVN